MLVDGDYQLLEGDRVWLPEIGLSLGRERGTYLGREREWLYWFDQAGNRLLTPEERAYQAEAQAKQSQTQAEQAQAQVEQEKLRADRLAKKLEELGVDPRTL